MHIADLEISGLWVIGGRHIKSTYTHLPLGALPFTYNPLHKINSATAYMTTALVFRWTNFRITPRLEQFSTCPRYTEGLPCHFSRYQSLALQVGISPYLPYGRQQELSLPRPLDYKSSALITELLKQILERLIGFEPIHSAWKADMLAVNITAAGPDYPLRGPTVYFGD